MKYKSAISSNKVKAVVAGMPLNITLEDLKVCAAPLEKKVWIYFSKHDGCSACTTRTIVFIENYLALERFISDDEDRREKAWEMSLETTMKGSEIRPDILYKQERYDHVQPLIVKKIENKIRLDKTGWINIKDLLGIEKYLNLDLLEYFENIIVANGIEYQNLKRIHQYGTGKMILLKSYLDKYFNAKYGTDFHI
jgi:hypothetical protein